MKKTLFAAMIAVALLFTLRPAIAGPGHDHSHDHEISEARAVTVAREAVTNLVKKSKLDSTWNEAAHVSVDRKAFGDSAEWVVSLRNTSSADKTKHNLYVFISLKGKYLAANFTGK